jgi:hypothetical protein
VYCCIVSAYKYDFGRLQWRGQLTCEVPLQVINSLPQS